jgi:eukaryotic-like serine/threonine-protein kinase
MGTGASSGTGSTAVEALQYVERLGRYRILARLGQGGMGTIHLAVAFGLADFRKLLVIKELRNELTSNERFVEMFLAEAKLAARLDHPNIVQTLEAGQDGERYFLAMEFLDGQPLVEILKRVDTAQSIPTSLLIQVLSPPVC